MKKELGQHFLVNKGAIKIIVDALGLKSGDTVIEIGPGHGELTKELLGQPVSKIVVIEKDEQLAKRLKSQISDFRLQIIEGDVLKELPKINYRLKAISYKLAGNIPYYLTGYLLRLISQLENKPSLIVFTLQKEVAERVVAQPPKMNLLAASVQYWAEPKIIVFLPARDFEPKPKVDSAVIKLKVQNDGSKVEKEDYYQFIKVLFKQPRKTALNNLRETGIGTEKLKKLLAGLGIAEKTRPQDLDLTAIEKLSQVILN